MTDLESGFRKNYADMSREELLKELEAQRDNVFKLKEDVARYERYIKYKGSGDAVFENLETRLGLVEPLKMELRQHGEELQVQTDDIRANDLRSQQAYNVLKWERDFSDAIMNIIGSLIVVYDREGQIVLINKSFTDKTGYTIDKLRGKPFWDIIIPSEYRKRVADGFVRYRDGQFPIELETRLLTTDGRRLVISTCNTALFDDSGKVKFIIGAGVDITERKQIEAELKDAKNQAEMYLDLMCHDISNMDQVAKGFLEMALDTLELDEAERELISKPLEALEASTALINNVRRLSNDKENGFRLHTIDLGHELDGVITKFSNVPNRNIIINKKIFSNCNILANGLLADVFSNIIGNAIKHSTGPLIINVYVERTLVDGEYYCQTIIDDNGPGIPDEHKDGIFTRFHDGALRNSHSGLGLYLVKTLVTDFHGRVWVEDRVPGDHTKGAKFVVMLPATKTE